MSAPKALYVLVLSDGDYYLEYTKTAVTRRKRYLRDAGDYRQVVDVITYVPEKKP